MKNNKNIINDSLLLFNDTLIFYDVWWFKLIILHRYSKLAENGNIVKKLEIQNRIMFLNLCLIISLFTIIFNLI